MTGHDRGLSFPRRPVPHAHTSRPVAVLLQPPHCRDRSARTVSTHRLWKALEVLERDHSAPARPEVVWRGLESLEYLIAAPIPQPPPSLCSRAAVSGPSFAIVASLSFRSLEPDTTSTSTAPPQTA